MTSHIRTSWFDKFLPESTPLKSKIEELRKNNLTDDIPPKPVVLVDKNICALDNIGASIRNFFFIPWAIAMIILCYFHISEFIDGWNGTERASIDYIESTKRMHGENYFEVTEDPVVLRMYNRINSKGKLTFRKYLDFRYNHTAAKQYFLISDIFYLLIYGVGMPILFIVIMRWPLYAPLYFDRDNRLVYSWRKGKVWVQRYDEIEVHQNFQGFYFHLYYLAEKGRIGKRIFTVQPTSNPIINLVSNKPFLSYIVNFMDVGNGRASADFRDFSRKRMIHLVEDKKPTNFEKQVISVFNLLNKSREESKGNM